MKHSLIKTLIGLPVLGAVIMVLVAASPTQKLTYPRRWIPMWEGKRESIMIHTDNIVTVKPMFDPSLLLKSNKIKNSQAGFLEVTLACGEKLEIYEPFEEFMERIRRSQ
jgi:hypothetical protein